MGFKKTMAIMLSAIISISLVGCEKFSNINSEQISAEKVDKELVESNNKFGFNVFKEISKDEKDKNVFISPLSISMALTMTYNGARNNTKVEISKVLGYEGMDDDKINHGYKTLNSYLENRDKNIELNVGNSIWIKEGKDINKEFININKNTFGAKVDNLDFSKASSVDKINNWIEKSTNMRKFANSDKTFYGEKEDFKAIKMPYDSGKVSMYAVLPKEGLDVDSFINTLDIDKWNSIKKSIGKEKKAVNVSFPKFQIEYGAKELEDSLIALGMKDAFSRTANFDGIREYMRISSVLHQAKIEVNEKGSEAAAATIVEMMETTMPMIEDPKEFIANRPFIFIMEDEESGTILFMGKLEEVKS